LGAGLYHTQSQYIQGRKAQLSTASHKSSSDLQSYQFECAWRLGQWDSLGDNDNDSAEFAEPSSSSFSRFYKEVSI
jgi:hypothetical protein